MELRNLNEILSRDEFRHHSIDALVVALAGPDLIRRLSEAMRRSNDESGSETMRELVRERMPSPFREVPREHVKAELERRIRRIIVFHCSNYSASGKLLNETAYGVPEDGDLSFWINISELKPGNSKSDRNLRYIHGPELRREIETVVKSHEGKEAGFAPALQEIEAGYGKRSVRMKKLHSTTHVTVRHGRASASIKPTPARWTVMPTFSRPVENGRGRPSYSSGRVAEPVPDVGPCAILTPG